jgi:hypothetical protein
MKKNEEALLMGRRGFLRSVSGGGAVWSIFSKKAVGLAPSLESQEQLQAHYPGARYLAGPWRLRIDRKEVGKQQQWYQREPTESEEKSFSVDVPSCWQVYVPDFGGGVGWYFKEFYLPSEWKGRVLRVKFWAVDYFAEVWLNGQSVGTHEGGYTPFEVDVSHAANVGSENRLVVRVVDPPRPLNQKLLGLPGWEGKTDGVVDGFNFMEIPMGLQSWQEGLNFGGIWQPVEVMQTDPVYVSDVFIEPKWAAGLIEVHVEVMNKDQADSVGRVQVKVRPWKGQQEVVGENEKPVKLSPGSHTISLQVGIRKPHAWFPEDPYLYIADVTVEGGGRVRDRAATRFGLREFTVKDGYFHLNGKRIFVKGGHHQGTYPTTLAYPPTREFAYEEVRILKEAGFNFCRLWQKPAPLSFLDAADELGLMLQEEPPLSNMQDSPYMLARSLREVRELVKRDRNRPAIVIWNMINEIDPPVKYVRQQCQLARDLDPTRLITQSAGGPTAYYLPYSSEEIPYLDEHPYPGAPLAEDVYDYLSTRGNAGQLCFFTEYGYGGMNDIESVLAKYGPYPRTYMEDYAGNALLKKKRDKAFRQSRLLKDLFPDIESLMGACQAVQADAVRLHSEAMRSNPAMGGYNYVQVFDSNAIEIDGLVDFWRDRRKKSFYAMQEANKPLLLLVRCSPMNGRSGEEVQVRVTLVNEEKIKGLKKLTVSIKSPSGKEMFRREQMVEAQPWVSVVFEERVKIIGESGRYPVEASLSEGTTPLVKKEDYCTIYSDEDLKWPTQLLAVFDPQGKLKAFLKERRIEYEDLGLEIERPAVITATAFSELWKQPKDFQVFIRLFSKVQRGCTVIFLGVPNDGTGPLIAAPIGSVTFLTPCSKDVIFPMSRVATGSQDWCQRVGPYAWGLTELSAGVVIPHHPIFEHTPSTGVMGRDYGNVAPLKGIVTDWEVSEEAGPAVQIYKYGSGQIILTSLNVVSNLGRDALAEKLLCNLVNYAHKGLPPKLTAEKPGTSEAERFKVEGYQDCVTKYLNEN